MSSPVTRRDFTARLVAIGNRVLDTKEKDVKKIFDESISVFTFYKTNSTEYSGLKGSVSKLIQNLKKLNLSSDQKATLDTMVPTTPPPSPAQLIPSPKMVEPTVLPYYGSHKYPNVVYTPSSTPAVSSSSTTPSSLPLN
ncbi:MAG: hypothetical protein WCP39_03395, partial [Chlamydiota bacterium]